MVKGMPEIKSDVIVSDNAVAFKMGGNFLILDENNDNEFTVAYILDSNYDLLAVFNDLFIAVEYFRQVVNLVNLIK